MRIKIDLKSINNLHTDKSIKTKKSSMDLSCGSKSQNWFGADGVFGLNLIADKAKKIFRCRLGFKKIPFGDDSFDYWTVYDWIE